MDINMNISKKRIAIRLLIISALVAVCTTYFFESKNSRKLESAVNMTAMKYPRVAKSDNGESLNFKPRREIIKSSKDQNVSVSWSAFKPLSIAEKKQFEVVSNQINELGMWGKMDPTKIEDFRAQTYYFGERGVAQAARELDAITIGQIKNTDEARATIQKIDLLHYFAKASWQVAVDAINDLASRPIPWDDNGVIIDKAQAYITFEAIQVVSNLDESAAILIIQRLPKEKQPAYIHHLAIGLRMSGLEEDAIKRNISNRFGKELVTFINPN
ncbi:MAG: hypothetical protein KBD78_11795 [Oligoflexales bacterium]|nr:hypothetical protein [Oligoflexales bacterium]